MRCEYHRDIRTRRRRLIDLTVAVHTGPQPLDPAEALRHVSDAEAGGTALFCGTVRSPNDGQEVDHLSYEVWEDRVDGVLRDIAAGALERFAATRVFVAHRTGRVEVGEPSVIVAVSAPHRAEAFDACRHVIDALKDTAPIWKKETTRDSGHWVGMPRQVPAR